MGLTPCVVAGCGPGAPGLVTPQVRAAALDCQVLAGAPRLLDLFPESRAERLACRDGLEPFLAALAPHLGRRPVTVLVTGDPGIASLAGSLVRHFPDQPFRRLPGISSVQAAFAAAGLDHQDACLVRAHGRLPAWESSWDAHRGPFAVLMGHPGAPAFAARLARRLDRGHLWRCERLSLPDQRIERLTPAALAAGGCHPLCVVIVEGAQP
jgi:precorrin-6y C5,15-methyltransferase (decarboxylating) CbiE subunit